MTKARCVGDTLRRGGAFDECCPSTLVEALPQCGLVSNALLSAMCLIAEAMMRAQAKHARAHPEALSTNGLPTIPRKHSDHIRCSYIDASQTTAQPMLHSCLNGRLPQPL